MWTETETKILKEYEAALGCRRIEDWIEDTGDSVSFLGRDVAGCIRMNNRVLASRNINEVDPNATFKGIARLVRRDGQLYLELNRKLSRAKDSDRRFWIAHELAHTFLVEENTFDTLSRTRQLSGISKPDEWICNRLAAAILIPRWLVNNMGGSTMLQAVQRAPYRLPRIAEDLVVPERMLARRLFQEFRNSDDIFLRIDERQNGKTGMKCKWAVSPEVLGVDFRKRLERSIFLLEAIPVLRHNESMTVATSSALLTWLNGKLSAGHGQQTSPALWSDTTTWARFAGSLYVRIELSKDPSSQQSLPF